MDYLLLKTLKNLNYHQKEDLLTTIKLRPSSSSRWINCPGSVQAESNYENKTSIYAQEGIDAHIMAADILISPLMQGYPTVQLYPGQREWKIDPNIIKYVDYVKKIKASIPNNICLVEVDLDLSKISENMKGTADCIILDKDKKIMHVIDLKFGKNVLVYATDNTQLILYAIGAYYHLEADIKTIQMHIVQPRRDHIDTWTIDKKELKTWEDHLCKKAFNALETDAPRVASEPACKFCLAKKDCAEFAQFKIGIDHFNIIKE